MLKAKCFLIPANAFLYINKLQALTVKFFNLCSWLLTLSYGVGLEDKFQTSNSQTSVG